MQEVFEKIKERLEDYKTKGFVTGFTNNPYEFSACHAMDKAIAIVDQVADEYGHDINVGSKWIPCSERLPKGRETYKVLVTDKDGIMAVCYFLEVTEAFKVCWDGEEFCGGIAWQPLPKPYKEKDND